MDINKEREYIKSLQNKIRELEIKKAKHEERLKFAEKRKEELENKMSELGCNKDTIDSFISSKENQILNIKDKIEKVLEKAGV